jgi:predicted Zn-dependent protease
MVGVMNPRRLPALLFSILLVACTTVKDTGRTSFNLISPDEEKKMGQEAFAHYKKEKPISNDAEKTAQLQRVADRLMKVITIENAEWEFIVFEDATPNAFALPGGKVGVHTGLFPITANDAGLAAVVGHEIGHVVARHGGERVSQQATASLGANALQALVGNLGNLSPTELGIVQSAFGATTQVGVLLPFSRKQELEADQLGALYMARAGYNPNEAVQVWVRFSELTKGKEGPEFMSTHPVNSTRIDKLNKFMPKAMEEYNRSPYKGQP